MNTRKIVLLVDDEAILLLAIRQELTLKLGSAVSFITALSAEEGLRKIDELECEGNKPALVISDWLMPGMKGDEFLRAVRKKDPMIKLVMLSGHADEKQIESISRDIDLYAFLQKPCMRDEIYTTVKKALE